MLARQNLSVGFCKTFFRIPLLCLTDSLRLSDSIKYNACLNVICKCEGMGLYYLATKKASRMANDDGLKITIRVSSEDIQLMEDFMSDNGIATRSDFIRDAIRGYIENSKVSGEAVGDGVFIHLGEVQLQTLENMRKDGTIYDAESYIRDLVLADIVPKDSMEDSKSRAFKAAQQASRMM